ncbi:MAG: type I methionyl aminopeptidase [Desulfobacteraceae bacterium]|nr:type I methionyl aminopeptidase [Desulfobacteraceae bacterium]
MVTQPIRSVKIGRNNPCPCNSGKKYKKCCLVNSSSQQDRRHPENARIKLKSTIDIQGIRNAGKLVLQTLQLVEDHLKQGITTDSINTLVHEFTLKNNGIPAPLNYRGFPKSVCTSINEQICHGIPGTRVLNDGDIINVDVTTILNGYYADANKTFFIGEPSAEAKKIVDVARQSLNEGIQMVKPDNTLGDIGWAIQKYSQGQGCSVVREFVGHGVGFEFHEAPQVPHFGSKNAGTRLVPGMVFTIEPMINLGGRELIILDDKWTAITKDRSLSAQFEQTILVTETGWESLTPYPL